MRRGSLAVAILCAMHCGVRPTSHLTLGTDCAPTICYVAGDAGCVWAVPECCDGVTPACPAVELDGVGRQLALQAIDAGQCRNINVVGCL